MKQNAQSEPTISEVLDILYQDIRYSLRNLPRRITATGLAEEAGLSLRSFDRIKRYPDRGQCRPETLDKIRAVLVSAGEGAFQRDPTRR